MKPINSPVVKQAVAALQAAMNAGEGMEAAFEQFHDAIADTIRQDFEQCKNDDSILLQRGYRVLTQEEKQYYEGIIEAGKAANPKQAFIDLVPKGMPETIIEDVYRNITNDHPLLNAISFTNVSYLTRWILNDRSVDKAIWGEINSEVTKQIEGGFKVIELAQNKLSCYALIPKDMLELGPVYLDNYIRTILIDCVACGLENAVVTGTGKNMPIGLDRDISSTASVVDGVYPKKTAIVATSFDPAAYGALVARLAKTEKGMYRKISSVGLACNPVDYFNKIMPASTVLNGVGQYQYNVFPVPTEVYQLAELAEGKAIMFIPEEYFLGLGSAKEGVITFDDSVKFLEDARAYLIKMHANGRAFDNTVAILLDISGLTPLYITVIDKTPAA